MANFPTVLDNLTSPTTSNNLDDVGVDHVTQHTNANTAINNLETKVGINSSIVTTTLDYLLKNASSIDPGHHHTNATLDSIAGTKVSGNITGLSGGISGETFPGSGIIVGTTDTQAITNKDLTSGTNTFPTSLATLTGTQTLTNKRRTRRVVTVTQSATPTINTDNTDVASITALAQAITSFTTNLSGTPVAGDLLEIQITDNGSARAITWGTSFESSGNISLPSTTVISTMLRVGFEWNTATTKWSCIAVA